MKINNGSKMCSPLSSFTLLNNTHQIAQFHLPQFSRKSCPWKIISVCVCVCVCVWSIFLCITVHISVLGKEVVHSRVDAKGQQFVRVHIVESAQVRQAQEELGEEGGVIWATAGDQ